MSTKQVSPLDAYKQLARENGLEETFLKLTGLNSMDELDPKNFSDIPSGPVPPPVTMKPSTSAATEAAKPLPKSAADASTGFQPKTASDMLKAYIGLKVNYAVRKRNSSYAPSSLMMDYILHLINDLLVDNFYFRRDCPDYHPYFLRLYYGILFWIQCLRAGDYAKDLDCDAKQALRFFIDSFPPETLPISGPLLDLFKTLCCSQPEVPTYGLVYPKLPVSPGCPQRSDFIPERPASHILPNIPGIFALLVDLNSKLNPDEGQPAIPSKGKHIPVTPNAPQAIVFGHHSFPVPATRSDLEKWALCSSGLQYPCEADKKLNEAFGERLNNFQMPEMAADDNLSYYGPFLHLDQSLSWFSQLRDVASMEASYFEGSGTLADCPPFGLMANQVYVQYQRPPVLPVAPTCSADKAALFPFHVRLKTTSRSLPELAEAMAATAQTNIDMFQAHPYYSTIGVGQRQGPFWQIAPEESSPSDTSSYLSLGGIVRGLMKSKR